MESIYPHITVKLIGTDGNAFSILGAVAKEMRKAGVAKPEVDRFMNEATAGDYDNLLVTCQKYVNIR